MWEALLQEVLSSASPEARVQRDSAPVSVSALPGQTAEEGEPQTSHRAEASDNAKPIARRGRKSVRLLVMQTSSAWGATATAETHLKLKKLRP